MTDREQRGQNDEKATETPGFAQCWAGLKATVGAHQNAYETLRALLNATVEDEHTLLEKNPSRIKGTPENQECFPSSHTPSHRSKP